MTEPDPATRLGVAVFRLARVLRQQDDGELTPTQRSALFAIDRAGPLTLGDLAVAEHVAPPTVTKVVGKLEDRGLVVRSADDDDRRVVLVRTTAEGAALLDRIRRRRATWLGERFAELDDDDRAAVEAVVPVLERLTGQLADTEPS